MTVLCQSVLAVVLLAIKLPAMMRCIGHNVRWAVSYKCKLVSSVGFRTMFEKRCLCRLKCGNEAVIY